MINEKLKITGEIKFIGVMEENNVVTILINEKQKSVLEGIMGDTFGYETTPIKIDSEKDEILFKCHSKFDVNIYENGTESDLTYSEIGAGSKVCLAVAIKDTQYKRKSHASAYLKYINVKTLVPYVKYNPFLDKEAQEI